MLSKSRSKQIFKLKYVLLIPIVFGMLLYTSSSAQEKVSKEEVNQEQNDEQLKEKLYKELIQVEESGASYFEKIDLYKFDRDKYINSREEYYRFQVWLKRLYEVSNNKLNRPNKFLNRTYEEYLEWKKTDEAKEIWENGTHNGLLRLVVNRMGKFTEDEQKRFDKKMEMIKKDQYFKELLITDAKGSARMTFDYPESNAKKESSKIENRREEIEVPFAVIDEAPVFIGCETLATNAERRKCTSDKITKHVQKNFNTDLAGDLGLIGRQRINVIFKIDTVGNVIGIRSRAPHPILEEEAIRIISLLPQMSPGKQNGENVIVPYSLPIIFQVADKKPISKKEEIIEGTINKIIEGTIIEPKDYSNDGEIPFTVVENAPIYQGCENISTNTERRKCTSDKIIKFVQKNFNTDLAVNLGLKGRQRINVIFKIDIVGNVIGIRTRAPHPDLEKEAIRVISLLPKMSPGRHKGENVIVPYSLPIIFQVQ